MIILLKKLILLFNRNTILIISCLKVNFLLLLASKIIDNSIEQSKTCDHFFENMKIK